MKSACWLLIVGALASCCLAQDYVMFGGNYSSEVGMVERASHLYCRGRLIGEGMYEGGAGIVNFPLPGTDDFSTNVWTLFLQYPVLSFIDPVRKRALFDVIAQILNTANGLSGLTFSDFCMGPYDQYGVATYDEGVVLRIYFRSTTINTMTVNTAFKAAIAEGPGTETTSRLRNFQGVTAINIRASSYFTNRVQLPGSNQMPDSTLSKTQSPNEDPTLHAVFRYSVNGNATLADVLKNAGPAADNPNPINYYLEAGDYVFIVFGAILCAFLLFVVVLGFCIHPFFIA